MSEHTNIRVDLGDIDYARLETEEDFREVAWEKMPAVLRQIGRGIGETAWDSMQSAFKGGMFKPNNSSSDRHRFVDNAVNNYVRNNTGNQQIERLIIERLQAAKTEADSGGATG